MAQPGDLLSTVETAEALGVERSTISRWVTSGRIKPAHRMPGATGAFLFDRREVQRVKRSLAEPEAASA